MESSRIIKASQQLFPPNIERLLCPANRGDTITLDLSEPVLFPCYAVVSLALLLHQWQREGVRVRLIPPGAPCADYLHRVDFWKYIAVNGLAELSVPEYRMARLDIDTLIELTNIRRGQLESLLEKKVRPLLESRGFAEAMIGYIAWGLGELVDNAFTHSHAIADPGGALIMAQSYHNRVEICVGDLGRGVRKSLLDNPEYVSRLASDTEALHLALQPRTSSWNGKGGVLRRGNGLYDMIGIAQGSGGRMDIRSGQGRLYFADGRLGKDDNPGFLAGTLVSLAIPVGEFDIPQRGEVKIDGDL